MRIVFMGTPDFSVPALLSLIDAGHDVVAVYTQPPKPAGRGKKEKQTAIHEIALAKNIDVYIPSSLKGDDVTQQMKTHEADVIVVVAYGLMIPPSILDVCLCLNIHASLLPRWRGAAPIQRAIESGDRVSGITIMRMDEGLDTGDMVLSESVPIMPDDTAGDLHDRLSDLGGKLMTQLLSDHQTGSLSYTKQCDDDACYASKIINDDAIIDWSQPSDVIDCKIRAYAPYPGARFDYQGETIKLLAADVMDDIEISDDQIGLVLDDQFTIACTRGRVIPRLIQRPGKKVMPVDQFLLGFRPVVGSYVNSDK